MTGGAEPRLRTIVAALESVIDGVLDRVFDEPLDIRDASEARRQLAEAPSGWLTSAMTAKGLHWAVARGTATKVGTRLAAQAGKVYGRKIVLPVTIGVDIAMGAKEGLRELQVLASYLVSRLRHEGHAVDRDFVRRCTVAIYLDPFTEPDFSGSSPTMILGVAQRWARHAVPGGKKKRRRETHARITAIERCDLARLGTMWRRAHPVIIDVDSAVVDTARRAVPLPPPPTPPPPAWPPAGSAQ